MTAQNLEKSGNWKINFQKNSLGLESAVVSMKNSGCGEASLQFRYSTRIVPFELGKEVPAVFGNSRCLIYTETDRDERFKVRIRIEDSSMETRTWATLEGDHLYSSTIVRGESLVQYAGVLEGSLLSE
ncbi:MAG: hypothetical protein EOM64_03345 [Erysipelotrichia bacterium]|nr:hypothetical protein [Erysipelotrichia bacterium]